MVDGACVTDGYKGKEPAEIKKPFSANFEEKGLDDLDFDARLSNKCVALQMADNKFNDLSYTSASSLPWLRFLNLSSNALECFPSLDECPNLVVLDVSLNEFKEPPEAMTPHAKLQSLSLDGCSLTELYPCLSTSFPGLKILSAVDNEIEKMSDIECIKGLKKLEQLFIADNPIADKPKYVKECGALQPTLKRVDLEFLGAGKGAVSLADRSKELDLVKVALKQKDGVMDANADHSSCSCIEGNPCATADSCYATIGQLVELAMAGHDWKKNPMLSLGTRVNIWGKADEVAKAARQAKGIKD